VARAPRDFLVIGNPENRRVTLFTAAAEQLGSRARVVPWLDVIRDPSCLQRLPQERRWVRIESWGENVDVERALLLRGAQVSSRFERRSRVQPEQIASATALRGGVVAPRQAHLGVEEALRELQRLFEQRRDWHLSQPLRTYHELFDKPQTHGLCRSLAVRVPEAIPAPSTARDLLAELEERAWRRAYVKLGCGSSASCLALVERGPHGFSVTTSMEIAGERLFNSLRVRRYARPALVDRVLAFLLNEGAHVERGIDKLASAGHHADVRFLYVRGLEPFVVLRQSKLPITNLHLGGSRGDVDRYRAKVGKEGWNEALEFVQLLGTQLGCWHLGVDVAFERETRRPFVLEANAFGDLLPGIERAGKSVYGWEILALRRLLDALPPEG
jgi:hypothetical protein